MTTANTKTKTGSEVPITNAPQRLPDSPFPTRISPKPYHRPGTPYRKVDLPHRDIKSGAPGVESPDLVKSGDPFEIDSDFESKAEITFRVETKTPKCKLTPIVLPFGPNPEEKRTKPPEKAPVEPAHSPAPIVGTPPRSPVPTPPVSLTSSISTPSSPLVLPIIPAAMGTVEKIKNALIESNRELQCPSLNFMGKREKNLKTIL